MDEALEKWKAELLAERDLPRQLVEELADDLDGYPSRFPDRYQHARDSAAD